MTLNSVTVSVGFSSVWCYVRLLVCHHRNQTLQAVASYLQMFSSWIFPLRQHAVHESAPFSWSLLVKLNKDKLRD